MISDETLCWDNVIYLLKHLWLPWNYVIHVTTLTMDKYGLKFLEWILIYLKLETIIVWNRDRNNFILQHNIWNTYDGFPESVLQIIPISFLTSLHLQKFKGLGSGDFAIVE